MIIAGAELENIQKCVGTTVLRPVVLKEAKIEANTELKGTMATGLISRVSRLLKGAGFYFEKWGRGFCRTR